MSVLDGLNPAQREAASITSGPVLILAGAGSGKTRTLTHRLAHLIENGVPPFGILAVTFTNKAAGEMKERIARLIGERAARMLWVGTFHSTGVRFLREHGDHIGLSRSFTIYDSDDSRTLVKRIFRTSGIDEKIIKPQAINSEISNAKNQLWTPDKYGRKSDHRFKQIITDIYRRYQTHLNQNNAVDFDDLLMLPVRLFREYPEVLQRYQDRFQHLLIDEYQDTNHAQYLLVKMLAKKSRNICAVGDDDQSIYGWRGADISNILNFEEDYPEAKIVRLEQNYRSTKRIIAAAGAVVRNNRHRKGKELWTDNSEGEQIKVVCLEDELDESRWIQRTILSLRDEGKRFRDMVILYRTNAQSRAIEEAFVRSGQPIPYSIVGGLRFYERKEIKDVLAYLRIILNPQDSESILRIVNVPKRGVGKQTVQKLMEIARTQRVGLMDAMRLVEESGLPARAANPIRKLVDLLDELISQREVLPAAEMINRILSDTGYRALLKSDNSVEAERRLENLEELVTAASTFAEVNDDTTLQAFLEEVTLVADIDSWQDADDKVTLMTVHSAKGLEFPVVFISGLEERLFPLGNSEEDPEQIEEERRLFYVALTRAEERVHLTLARRRRRYDEWLDTIPSRFINELPEEHLDTTGFQRESRSTARRLAQVDVPREFTRNEPVRRPGSKRTPAGRPVAAEEHSQVTPDYDTFSQDVEEFLQVGRYVFHQVFGRGQIMSHEGRGRDLKIIVRFENGQKKKILVRAAHLEPTV